MNITLNINLAGHFFYIDELAYKNLNAYLDEIKRYFKDETVRDEIIADIEARIAELLIGMLKHERQVITQNEVDEIIKIMGQPHDYKIDEEEQKESQRKLFRDQENALLGGVASGLSYYIGLKTRWVRIIWLILGLFSWGGFIVLYLILWIVLPKAETTAEKLSMKGEPINISNIEKKIKEGIEDVADRVKNTDYSKTGKSVETGLKGFFDALTRVLESLFLVIRKLLGIILIIATSLGIISLVIAVFTLGTVDLMGIDLFDLEFNQDHWTYFNGPLWILSVPVFFFSVIPMVYLLLFGKWMWSGKLKNTIGMSIFLGVLWIISLFSLIVISLQQWATFY